MTDAPYAPIDCSFYDRLEHWAIRRTSVEVVWTDEGTERRTTARIADVFARAGADYLRLDDGTEVRLDRLVTVDGLALPKAC